MYKVKDAADQLGITRVEIFEILLSHREQFESFVVKNNSITYITEGGLSLLREIFSQNHTSNHEREVPLQQRRLEEEPVRQSMDMAQPEVMVLDSEPQALVSPIPSLTDDTVNEGISQWLDEIRAEDQLAADLDHKLKEMRIQVTNLRNKLMLLDSEIKRKDEALMHYHGIMKDDTEWMQDLERKMLMLIQQRSSSETEIDIASEDLERGNFFKFFKR